MYPSEERIMNVTGGIGGAAIGRQYQTATAAPDVAQGRVTEATAQAHQLAERLGNEIAGLEQRISAVLRPASPSAIGVAEKQRSEPSQLASGLDSLNAKLYALLGGVQSIAARVDL